MRMPALFLGHGNPMNAIERNEFHLGWAAVARRIPRLHGFPKALFDVRYPAPGDPALAARAAELITSERVGLDPERGLDHGAWSVLIAMYPQANVPVVQLGIDTREPGAHHLALARQLAPLRDEGVLVLGSGNVVHNLGLFDFRDPTPLGWALTADATIRELVDTRALPAAAVCRCTATTR